MAHEHKVIDTDSRFVIDKATRQISTATGYTTIMQFDHNSERLTFQMPKLIDGHDMTKCNEVEVHYINIDSSTKQSNVGVYAVDDLQVDPENADKAILSWLISNNATQYAGVLNFLIKFKFVVEGKVEYAWNTAVYNALTVSNGIDNGEIIAEEYADILAQWESRIDALEQNRFGVIGMGDKLEWDGNRNTPKVLMMDNMDAVNTVHKVSDIILTKEDFANGRIVCGYFGSTGGVFAETGEDVHGFHFDIAEKEDGTLIVPVPDENANWIAPSSIFCVPEGTQYEPGIYFGAWFDDAQGFVDRVVSLTLPGFGKFPVIKEVEAEFLPEFLKFGEVKSFANTLVWDGNGSKLLKAPEPAYDDWYWLSDVVFTEDDLANGFYVEFPMQGETPVTWFVKPNEQSWIADLKLDDNNGHLVLVSYDENGNEIEFVRFTGYGIIVCAQTVPMGDTQYNVYLHTLTIPGFNGFPTTVTKSIDKSYLPKAPAVFDCTNSTVSGAEFNALLTALRTAGYLSK
jgi:hypothetical protein